MLNDLKIESFMVEKHSSAVGKSLGVLQLRTESGTTVIAVNRGDTIFDSPAPDMPLQQGDVVYLLGSLEQVRDAIYILETGTKPSVDAVIRRSGMHHRPDR
jgi:K+/H+ antiporter YhaU regulatory subunit KhtT